MPFSILTIGHSTHPVEEFVDLLQMHGVEQLVDVRTIPKSRHNPQFNREALDATLAAHGISYTHMPGLGGLRHPRKDSVNTAWRNASFRGYADYMQTPEFGKSIASLVELAEKRQTVIMCAEAVPWRCHRSLISDALLARGITVEDIMNQSLRKPHIYTSYAKIDGENVTYPGVTTA